VSEPQENENAPKDTNINSCVTPKWEWFPLASVRTGQGGHGPAHFSWGFLHSDVVSNRYL